jgi:hypothetical protein
MEPNTSDSTKSKTESVEPNTSQISTETWKDILHVSVIGNAMFPQSFFAQGLLIAERVSNLANQGKLSLDAFLTQNPEKELIFSTMENARDKSHGAYAIKSHHATAREKLASLWVEDKLETRHTLLRFAEMVHGQNLDNTRQGGNTLHLVFSNPDELSIIANMLGIVRFSLLSEEVKQASKKYKAIISIFMQHYPKDTLTEVPEGYDEKRGNLYESLTAIQEKCYSYIRNELVKQMEDGHPENQPLLNRLKASDTADLFGPIQGFGINPLRNK